jgi:GNAT superfamily N-acetyltransferase
MNSLRDGAATPTSEVTLAKAATVRPARLGDVDALLDVHYAAVHESGAQAYPVDVLDAWSPPSDSRRRTGLASAIDAGQECFLVCEIDGRVVAWSALHPDLAEVRAVYVHPAHSHQGIGKLLLRRLEEFAIVNGLTELRLKASLNAERFYRSEGYVSTGATLRRLNDGCSMACVAMKKALVAMAGGE